MLGRVDISDAVSPLRYSSAPQLDVIILPSVLVQVPSTYYRMGILATSAVLPTGDFKTFFRQQNLPIFPKFSNLLSLCVTSSRRMPPTCALVDR
jgi:hypothetical protein